MDGRVVVGGTAKVTEALEQRGGANKGRDRGTVASGEAPEREQMCRSGARCGGARSVWGGGGTDEGG
ncbi:UNVERIFIED_CONTAM: hypothetical protein Sangu_2573100 [Sesamum angustifolium]|uniref:Uncharacterized protein n=1 Tax=Sesamum angustifolium TaxID=2727405 RepID=A0AAW2JA26_9LAMI